MEIQDQVAWSYPKSDYFNVAKGQLLANKTLEAAKHQFFIAPFKNENTFWTLNLDDQNLQKIDVSQLENSADFTVLKGNFYSENTTLVSYQNLVQAGLKEIVNGKIEKVVLSAKHFLPYNNHSSLIQKLRQLRIAYPDAFIFLLISPYWGTWITASPELLLSNINKEWLTYALAGTKPSPATFSDFGSKEKAEQKMVVQYILSVFSKLGYKAKMSDLSIKEAGNISHLLSTITCQTNGTASAADLISQLHPTPAVGGIPKTEAFNFIVDNEGYNRHLYSGFIGEILADGQCQAFVNLRTAQLSTEGVSLFAGAGITKDSQPLAEALEVKSKMNILATTLFNTIL